MPEKFNAKIGGFSKKIGPFLKNIGPFLKKIGSFFKKNLCFFHVQGRKKAAFRRLLRDVLFCYRKYTTFRCEKQMLINLRLHWVLVLRFSYRRLT